MGLLSRLRYYILAGFVLCLLSVSTFIYFTILQHQQKRLHSKSSETQAKATEKAETGSYIELSEERPATRPLPHPRSHLVTNSTHVIGLFSRKVGCTDELRRTDYRVKYQYLDIRIVCQKSHGNCYKWIWDPANWTLTHSSSLEECVYRDVHICAYPIVSNRVHKVVYSNKTTVLPNCNPKNYNCTTIEPYFDKALNMRINWSPCCREMNIKLMEDTADILEAQGIRYVMIGGAVISVVRENGTFLPYDTDLDMMIDVRDRERLKNETALSLKTLGYYLTWHKEDTYVRFCVNTLCDAHIDTWFYEELPQKKNRLKYVGMGFWVVNKDMILPTTWEYFEGKKYRFPHKIMDYLKHEYASGVMAGYHNWKDVFLCNHKRGRKCTHYPE